MEQPAFVLPSDEKISETITKIGTDEIKKHKTEDFSQYKLVKIQAIGGTQGKYSVTFDKPNTEDAQVQMIIDIKENQVIDYKDQWS